MIVLHGSCRGTK